MAQTLGKVWSLEAPHCEGPAWRTSVVQPCGGSDHLVLLLLPYREKEIKVSPPSLSFHVHVTSIPTCEGSNHFLGRHALKFNSVSLRHATCKYDYTITFRIDIFIDLLGFNLLLAYLKR